MHKMTLLALTCTALAACAVSKVDPLSIPLLYKANPKNAGMLGSPSCNSLSQIQASDARSDKTLGVRTHESKPLTASVTAGSDPAAWVQQGVQGFLAQNGITLQGSGPKLLVSLDTLHTTESIWHRSSYDARIAMTAQLQSASGKVCWKGSGAGTGGDYGYSGSTEAYQDSLNSALDAATAQMTEAQGFKDALCHCGD